LFDAAGRRYLDAYNNVACVGHGHPEIVEAIARQAGGGCETILLEDCGHAPHRDRREAVLEATMRFVATLT
jgi:4-aminobutyrate aminotransferase-like enzyme